jgi:hypothetical protein
LIAFSIAKRADVWPDAAFGPVMKKIRMDDEPLVAEFPTEYHEKVGKRRASGGFIS